MYEDLGPPKQCTNCGYTMHIIQKYCPNCGMKTEHIPEKKVPFSLPVLASPLGGFFLSLVLIGCDVFPERKYELIALVTIYLVACIPFLLSFLVNALRWQAHASATMPEQTERRIMDLQVKFCAVIYCKDKRLDVPEEDHIEFWMDRKHEKYKNVCKKGN